MARQSHLTYLLTRQAASSERFARRLAGRVVISPLMRPEFLVPEIPALAFSAVVFSSETGVEAAQGLRLKLPRRAYCVGGHTAAAARASGFEAISAEGDVAALAEMILAKEGKGPILIIRPEIVAGKLHQRVERAGIHAVSAIAYRQQALKLTQEAVDLLTGDQPVLLPLFSPRSAKLFCGEFRRIAGSTPLFIVAISSAVIAELDIPAQDIKVADRPVAEAMYQALAEMTGRVLGG
jgi:uroporphyrinogen-III synthase